MSSPSLEQTLNKEQSWALLALGFRPFFLAAGLFSIVAIALWALMYASKLQLPLHAISPSQWHAHEMIYGYSTAVIAGFLLTAVKNWTNQQTTQGPWLLCLILIWLAARVLLALGETLLAGGFDLLFLLCLNIALARPIIKVRQWRELAVLSKVLFLMLGNALFYLGALGYVTSGVRWAIEGGLYLIVGLVLMIGRRVVPLFIEWGLGEDKQLFNSKWLDFSSLFLFLLFFIAELASPGTAVSAWSALLLSIINGVRLIAWYRRRIWQKPLLWSLYLALWWIVLGFLIFPASIWLGVSKFIALHTLAYGGIGLITLSMMSRVALGHTGRDTHQPPRGMTYAFIALLLGATARVLLPLVLPQYYLWWVSVSQLLWLFAFAVFSFYYGPILSRARVDGQPG